MGILNIIPLIGIIIGVFLLFIIIPDRKNFVQNRLAKTFLLGIIIINIFSQLDSYLDYNGFEESDYIGLSYLLYHVQGFLFFGFINSLLKNNKLIRQWGIIMLIFTLIRTGVLFTLAFGPEYHIDPYYTIEDIIFFFDPYVSNIVNLIFLIWTFIILRRIDFMVELSAQEAFNANWLRRLTILSVLIYIAVILNSMVWDSRDDVWDNQWKIETVLANILFFAISIFAVRFPAYSIHGDVAEDTSVASGKYANSNLQKEESLEMWNIIQNIFETDKSYLQPEYRLNNLADECNKSVHHISQIINENSGYSFSELLNKYRIEEAKNLLLSDKMKQLTILAIAYEVGFNSKTSFYSSFKKHIGITPSEFRKSNIV